MEDRSSRRMRTLVTRMAHRGLSANELARALISMMARSTCSNQRPDTLMQDRKADGSTKASCNARPDHTFGSKAVSLRASIRFPVHPQKRKSEVADQIDAPGQDRPLRRYLGGSMFDTSSTSSGRHDLMPNRRYGWSRILCGEDRRCRSTISIGCLRQNRWR